MNTSTSMPSPSGSQLNPHELDHWTARLRSAAQLPKRHLETTNLIRHDAWLGVVATMNALALASGTLFGLIGPRGVGKTQLATDFTRDYCAALVPRAIRHLREYGPTNHIRYTKSLDMFRHLRSAFDTKATKDETSLLRTYTTPHLLIIDEQHEIANSEYEQRTFRNIIDHRYDDRKDTILIANLDPAQFATHVGLSIMSRLSETGRIFQCEGPQWINFRTRTKP